MAICPYCKKNKSLNQFHKDKSSSNGRYLICKECLKIYRKKPSIIESQRRGMRKCYYKLIQKYPWYNSFNGARERCRFSKRRDEKYYHGKGIKFLLTKSEMAILWERDKGYLMEKPSIDRLNNNGNYEFSNCRFIELRLNAKGRKYGRDR